MRGKQQTDLMTRSSSQNVEKYFNLLHADVSLSKKILKAKIRDMRLSENLLRRSLCSELTLIEAVVARDWACTC